jgi:MscS family membrane protein
MIKAVHDWFLQNMWLVAVIIDVVIGGVVSILLGVLANKLIPVYQRKGKRWHLAVAESIRTPGQLLIWSLVILFVLPKLFVPIGFAPDFLKYMGVLRHLVSAVLVFWFLMRLVKGIERSFHDRIQSGVGKVKDRTQVSAFAQIIRVVVIVLFLLVMMPIFGIPTAALLTFGGASTVVIGFAVKDTLANFLGGLMVYWDRPFSVGDWIRSPDKQIEGTVEDIGWRLTRIRTFDKRPLYVPNGFFSTISVENPSRMTNRRIKKTIGVRYTDATQMPAMLQGVQMMLKKHPEIDKDQTLMVNMFEFGDCSLNFFIYTFTKTTDWVKFEGIQQDVLLKTYEIIRQHGADCAFPTRTLDLPDNIRIEEIAK